MVPNYRLHRARERRGWSLQQCADQVGTTPSQLERWEQGTEQPTPEWCQKLSTAFAMNADALGLPQDEGGTVQRNAFFLLPEASPALSPPQSEEPGALESIPVQVQDPTLPLSFGRSTSLIGRDTLFEQGLHILLTQQRLAFSGLPGIGKTALMIALAQNAAVRERFKDGILCAGLGSHPHVYGIYSRWASLLSIPFGEIDAGKTRAAWRQAIITALKDRRMLILLDDAWRSEDVEAFLLAGEHCGYIVTARSAQAVSSLFTEQILQVPELTDEDGVRLLERFAPTVVQQEPERASELANAVSGIPLALTLVGKYIGAIARTRQQRRVLAALESLRDAERRLHLSLPHAPLESSSPGSTTEISMQSVLEVSYQYLPDEARNALRALAVLPSKPFRLSGDVTLAVTAVSVSVLDILRDAGMLERPNENSYMTHAIVTDYMRMQGLDGEAVKRLIAYSLEFLQKYQHDRARLENESTILFTALHHARVTDRRDELVKASLLFMPFLVRVGWYERAVILLKDAYSCARNAPDRIRLLEYLSLLTYQQGSYAQAQHYAEQGLDVAYSIQDKRCISRLLTSMGMVAHDQGDYEQAENRYLEGLKLARQERDQEQVGILLKNLGVVAKKRGDYDQAQRSYLKGLSLARKGQNFDLICLLLMNLGVIAMERGEYDQAEAFYQEALDLARQPGYQERICVLLSNLGVVADARGDYAYAERLLQEGAALAEKMKHRERLSLLLLNLGVIAERQGHDQEAEAYYQEGLELAQAIAHPERISLFLLNLGDLALEHGDEERAGGYLQKGLTLARRLGHQERISDLLLHLASLAIKCNQLEQASAYIEEGLVLARRLQQPKLLCQFLFAQAEYALLHRDAEEALQFLQEMQKLVPQGNRALLAYTQYGFACVAAVRDDPAEARRLGRLSHEIFAALGHRRQAMVQKFIETLPTPPESDNE